MAAPATRGGKLHAATREDEYLARHRRGQALAHLWVFHFSYLENYRAEWKAQIINKRGFIPPAKNQHMLRVALWQSSAHTALGCVQPRLGLDCE